MRSRSKARKATLGACLRAALLESCEDPGSRADCRQLAGECAERRERARELSGQTAFEPWPLTEDACVGAFSSVDDEHRADLFECLRFVCHPTHCFSASPGSLVDRAERRKKR